MDFYKVLAVARHATTAEIKTAYRVLALKLHPDVTGNDKEKAKQFQLIANAYNTLGDEEKRRQYDRTIGVQRVSSPHSSSSSSSSSQTVYSRPNVRPSPRRSGATTIPREHFNMEAWNAFHYGDNAVVKPAVQQNSWMNGIKDNPHQSYYAKKNREAKMKAQGIQREAAAEARGEAAAPRGDGDRSGAGPGTSRTGNRSSGPGPPQQKGSSECAIS